MSVVLQEMQDQLSRFLLCSRCYILKLCGIILIYTFPLSRQEHVFWGEGGTCTFKPILQKNTNSFTLSPCIGLDPQRDPFAV